MSSLTVRLPAEIDKRLNNLAKRTHRTKTFYVREAILSYIEDLEDTFDALKALKETGENYSMVDIVREMNLTKEELKEIGLED
jgi:RHH-type rel operon transcriptional repressor/antitoxin RelB